MNHFRVISGGQIGVDQIALKVAKQLNIETGGTAPRSYKTLSGNNPRLLKNIYGLKEMDNCRGNAYVVRSIQNVKDADGTLVFIYKRSVGSIKTAGYAYNGKWCDPGEFITLVDTKPRICGSLMIINPVNWTERLKEDTIKMFADWIEKNKIETLNVAGHSKMTLIIEKNTKTILNDLLKSIL